MKTKTEIILGMHQAMLCNINCHLRMLCATWDDESFSIRLYVEDKKYYEFAKEAASIILTEFEINTPDFKEYKDEVIISKSPLNQLDPLKLILFARDEDNIELTNLRTRT